MEKKGRVFEGSKALIASFHSQELGENPSLVLAQLLNGLLSQNQRKLSCGM